MVCVPLQVFKIPSYHCDHAPKLLWIEAELVWVKPDFIADGIAK